MREKFQLLSRFIFSPPNPRVSGGLLLLHGGFPHRNGGLPLPRGGCFVHPSVVPKTPPLRQIRTFIAAYPHQSLKSRSFPSFPHPPPNPPNHLLLTDPPHRRSLPRSDPFTQSLRAATKLLLPSLSPPSFCSRPPRLSFLSAALRPPPKPPPLKRYSYLVSFPAPKLSGVYLVVPPDLRLALSRPPPKPPWLLFVFLALLVWVVDYGVSMGYWFQAFGTCFSWPKYAHQVFDENPHRAIWTSFCFVLMGYASGAPSCFLLCFYGLIKCSVWSRLSWIRIAFMDVIDMDISLLVVSSSKYKYYAGTMRINSTFNFPSYRQASLVSAVRLDHRETTHSRNVLIPAKEMIRNWIDSKTVASPSIMAIYHGRELFDWLIGLALCDVVEPLWFVVYLGFDPNVVYVLNFRSNSCLGYAPPLVNHPECNAFSQLMK